MLEGGLEVYRKNVQLVILFVQYFWNVVVVVCNQNYHACFFRVFQFSLQIVQLDSFSPLPSFHC